MTDLRTHFAKDFLASIVVFLVALPLCLGIAIASGVPPAYGLLTGIVGGLVVGFLAGNPLQVSGPAAGLAVFTYELIERNGLAMLGPIVLAAGLIQLGAGLLKGGQLFRAISPSVIYGMLAGIGILIFGSQFHVMVDDQPRASGVMNLISIPEAIYKGIFPLDGSTHHMAAFLGLLTIVILVGWGRMAPKRLRILPGALIGVVVASTVAAVFEIPVRYVNVPANLFGEIEWASWSNIGRVLEGSVLFDAVAMAFVASAETLLCATAVDRLHDGPRTNYDKELAAQGVGNAICGFMGALPMTGVIVRSAANVNAGARTRTSAILHGAWLLVLVVMFPSILALVPTSSLAAVLVFTGYKLVNVQKIREMIQYGGLPVLIYAATVITIVAKDLLTGIIVGLILSLFKLIYLLTHMGVEVVRSDDGKRVDVRLSGTATFIRLPKLADTLEAIPSGVEAHVHFKGLDYIDHACMEELKNWQHTRTQKGDHVLVEWEELMDMYRQRNVVMRNNKPENGPGSTTSSLRGDTSR